MNDPSASASKPDDGGVGIFKLPLLPQQREGANLTHVHETVIDLVDTLLLRRRDPIDTFAEMWFSIFIWTTVSYIGVHLIGALIAGCQLRRHKWWPYMLLPFLVMCFVGPLTVGLLTSATIAWAYATSGSHMSEWNALAFGLLQTAFGTASSFTRILATL